MPYPSQISREQIIETAISHIAADGVHKLSLGKVARTLGVSTPSLYRHIANKDELIRAVNLQTLERMFKKFAEVDKELSAEKQLHDISHAQRDFAHANPHTYLLAFTTPDNRPNEALLVNMVLPLQALIAQLSGEEKSLTALRGLLALVHGFIMLELNDQLRRGGDLSAEFDTAISLLLSGVRSANT